MARPAFDSIRPIRWRDDRLQLLDQRRLPAEESWLACAGVDQVIGAIRDMVVRGAPAIGIAAAFGAVLAARACYAQAPEQWREPFSADLERLRKARPTAVNLAWAVNRMAAVAEGTGSRNPFPPLLAEAQRIHGEDIAANHRIGELGLSLLPRGSLLTHCNAGALATGGYGTALGVARAGYAAGLVDRVYADETRPWLQGSRLTAWELQQEGIPVTLQADAAAAQLMHAGKVTSVVVGSDRIAANGDVANKIGTYALALLARAHGIPFLVAAPVSTIDPDTPTGAEIPVEERSGEEVARCGGRAMAPPGVAVRNPVFDVTPAELVDALVTERGVVERPDAVSVAALLVSRQGLSHRKAPPPAGGS